MAVPKWNEQREAELVQAVGNESPVTQETVAQVAEQLETSARSVSSKLRKLGYEVELASGAKAKTFSEEAAEALAAFVEANSGNLTYGEIAENFEGGKYTAKQVQGKILSLEMTEHVKPTPKAESVKTYSDAEEATFIEMANEGAFIEDIAAKLGREMNSIRGKALSLMRSGDIDAIPKQRESKAADKVDGLTSLGDVSGLTVSEIADKLGKTTRGIKTMLTRRGVTVADYDGAAKKAKLAEA